MKKILFLFLFLVYSHSDIYCSENIYFNFDYAVFKGEDEKSILEIYYSVNQKSLIYLNTWNNFEADALINISITDILNNNTLVSNSYKTPSIVSDTSFDKINQKLIGQINYVLKNGKYLLKITGSDFNDTTKKDVLSQEIVIDNIETGKIKLSDIELSTLIKKSSDSKSIFYKNTLDIIPNPSGLYGMNLNELYYYFETYGLNTDKISDKFYIIYSVFDLNNQQLISYNKEVKRTGDSKADYGKIKIDNLKRGSYIIRITISDSIKNVSISNEKKFYIYNNLENIMPSSNQNDFLKSEYAAMPEKTLDDEFEKMNYILKETEISKYKKLISVNDKRKFIFDFWSSKDLNPYTQVLESKISYFKRIEEANKLYKEYFKKGWQTDRGRIYVVYGKPDDVDRHPFEAETKSYEVWKYYTVEGGGDCIFIELQPTTDVYWLVHSTFRNELKNLEWENQLDAK